MLNQEELLAFTGTGKEGSALRLTPVAVSRLLEVCVTYAPLEMDFKLFLDLVLAIENRSTVESVTYFWRILDFEGTGRLGPSIIAYFYGAVQEALRADSYEAPSLTNVIVEINDILACNDPRGPCLNDLIQSGQGTTVISMLLDVNGFWQYDNRESLMQQPSSREQGDGGAEDDDLG